MRIAVIHFAIAIAGFALGTLIPNTYVFTDIMLYRYYADRTFAGDIPYVDFAFEYPPLSLPLILLPRLFTSSPLAYAVVFMLQVLAFDFLAVHALTKVLKHGSMEDPGTALNWYHVYLFVLSPIVISRMDMAPAALVALALSCWLSARTVSAGAWLGTGALIKFFPAVLVAPLLVWEWRNTPRFRANGAIVCTLVLFLGILLWFGLAPSGAHRTFQYHSERGLQVESLYGGAMLMVGKLTGNPVPITYNHGAFHLADSVTASFGQVAVILQLSAMAFAVMCFVRNGCQDVERYATACLLAFIIGNKVLSPQYMLWLLPLIPMITGRFVQWIRRLFFTASLLTTIIFPFGYATLIAQSLGGVAVLNLRNCTLVVLFCVLCIPLKRVHSRPAEMDAGIREDKMWPGKTGYR